jgi:hypothetical protein
VNNPLQPGRDRFAWYGQLRAGPSARQQQAIARQYAQDRQFTELYTPETYQVLHLLHHLDLLEMREDLDELADRN